MACQTREVVDTSEEILKTHKIKSGNITKTSNAIIFHQGSTVHELINLSVRWSEQPTLGFCPWQFSTQSSPGITPR